MQTSHLYKNHVLDGRLFEMTSGIFWLLMDLFNSIFCFTVLFTNTKHATSKDLILNFVLVLERCGLTGFMLFYEMSHVKIMF